MRIGWTTSLLAIMFSTALAVSEQASRGTSVLRLSHTVVSQSKNDDIIAEETEPSNSNEREARRTKNARYNTGGPDLTKRDPETERFIEQVWPRREVIPAAESAVIATGTILKVQPYLSADRSRIYTEITIRVDELLKQDRASRTSTDKTLVIDRLGGMLRLKTGRVVRDDVQIDNLGITEPGKRYLLFARSVNDGSDVSLIESYELVEGKVFTNDSRPRRLITRLAGVPQAWASERVFLDVVRQEVRKEVGQVIYP